MEVNYWSKIVQARVSRRRALAAGGGTGLGLALLAACGGDGEDSKQPTSSLIGKPVDTTSKAKRGGIMFLSRPNNPGEFDPLTGQGSMTSGHTAAVYSRLLAHKVAKYPDVVDGTVEGDAATSWELSPDASQITLKLREMPFDQRPPTSG